MATKDKMEVGKFDKFKEFKGSKYSGMKVGASHKWYYDQGEWRERKVTPEEWDIYYETTKRRAGKAPEGSGAPLGTEYNWLIVAHQRVDKLDANSYMTRLEGKKFKVAHKRANKEQWNIREKTQRKKVIAFLEQVIQDLKEADENEQVPYTIGKKERIYGLEHRNKEELYKMAKEQDIPNRSQMSRGVLLKAIKNNLENGHEDGVMQQDSQPGKTAAEPSKKLSNKTKGDLYKIAQENNIKGRSEMKKAELLRQIRKSSTLKKEIA